MTQNDFTEGHYFWDVVTYSIRENQQEIFEHMFTIKPTSEFNMKKIGGKLPIELAASCGHKNLVEFMLMA